MEEQERLRVNKENVNGKCLYLLKFVKIIKIQV